MIQLNQLVIRLHKVTIRKTPSNDGSEGWGVRALAGAIAGIACLIEEVARLLTCGGRNGLGVDTHLCRCWRRVWWGY